MFKNVVEKRYGVFVNNAAGEIILVCFNQEDLWNGIDQKDPCHWLIYTRMVPQHFSLYFESENYEKCLDYVDELLEEYCFSVDDQTDSIIVEGYDYIPNDDFAEVAR